MIKIMPKKTFKTKEEALDFKYKKLDECNKKQSVSVSRPEYDEGKGKWIVDYDVYKIKYEEL